MVKKLPQGRRKHVPVRTCVFCRKAYPKRSLVRIVSSEQGLVVDSSGKQAGRGAYLCRDRACWEKALASKDVLSRALRQTVSDQDKAALLVYLEQDLVEEPGRAAKG